MRTCKNCLQEKELNAFKKHAYGYRHVCKKCQYIAEMSNLDSHAKRLARMKKYRDSEKGKQVAAVYEKLDTTKKSRKISIKKYESGKGRVKKLFRTINRRLAKAQRTPKWLTDNDYWIMEQAYEIAALRSKLFGFEWHVDHILPLQGTTVSGLHVPTNLQVIPWLDNQKKHNKIEVKP